MTALYFHALRPQDRVAVKPHASPIFHAIQYLLGKQTQRQARELPRLQGRADPIRRAPRMPTTSISPPARSAWAWRRRCSPRSCRITCARTAGASTRPEGRMVALVGDAELDEGNIFEALLEGWKHGLRNCWWIVDYNRQSLDQWCAKACGNATRQLFEQFRLGRRGPKIRLAAAGRFRRARRRRRCGTGSIPARTSFIRRWYLPGRRGLAQAAQ